MLRRYAARHGGQAPEDRNQHAELGVVTLATLAVPAADWERSLKALEQLAYDAHSKKKRSARPAKPRR